MLMLNETLRTSEGALHSARRGILVAVVVCVLIEVFRAGPLWQFALIVGTPLAVVVAMIVDSLARRLIARNKVSIARAVVWGALVYGGLSVLSALYGELSTATITMGSEQGLLIENGRTTKLGYVEFFVFRPFLQATIGAVAALAGWLAAFGAIARVNIIPD